MSSPSSKKTHLYRKVSIVVLITLALLVISFFKDKLVKNTYDVASLTNVYSDGLYEYSFKYPADATIGYSQDGVSSNGNTSVYLLSGSKISIYPKTLASSQTEFCTLQVIPKQSRELSNTIKDFSKVQTITLNTLVWSKLKYTVDPQSFLYRYDGIKWQKEQGDFIYLFQARSSNEKWCETIITTFSFTLNTSNAIVSEIHSAKQEVVTYALQKYPNKRFVQGGYVYRTNSGGYKLLVNITEAPLENMQKMLFIFDEPEITIPSRKLGIVMDRNNNKWNITKETEDIFLFDL